MRSVLQRARISRVLAVCLAVTICLSARLAVASVGDPAGPDPFYISFDEYGNALVQTYNPDLGGYNPPVYEAGTVQPGGGIVYDLPEFVINGSVLVRGVDEFENNGYSDRIEFFDEPGHNTSSLLYQSYLSPDEVTHEPADVPSFPFDSATVVDEVGPEGNNYFDYVAGSGDPATTNFYHGVSDGQIPEPMSASVLAVGALLALPRRRGR